MSVPKRDLFPIPADFSLTSESPEDLEREKGTDKELSPLFAEINQAVSQRRRRFIFGIFVCAVVLILMMGFIEWWASGRTPGFLNAWGRVVLLAVAVSGMIFVFNIFSRERWLARVAKESLILQRPGLRPGETPQSSVQQFFVGGLLGLRMTKSVEAINRLESIAMIKQLPPPAILLWPFLLRAAKQLFQDRSHFANEWSKWFESAYPAPLGGGTRILDLVGEGGEAQAERDISPPVARQIITDGSFSIVQTTLAGSILDYRVVVNVGRHWYFMDGKPYDEVPESFDRVRVMEAMARLTQNKKVSIPVLVPPNWTGGPTLDWMRGEWLGASPAKEEVLELNVQEGGQVILESSSMTVHLGTSSTPWRFGIEKSDSPQHRPTTFRVVADNAMIIHIAQGAVSSSSASTKLDQGHPYVFIRRPRKVAEPVQ